MIFGCTSSFMCKDDGSGSIVSDENDKKWNSHTVTNYTKKRALVGKNQENSINKKRGNTKIKGDMQFLYDKLVLRIFMHLSSRELGQISLVCRQWNRVASRPLLWKKIIVSLKVTKKNVDSKGELQKYLCDSFPYQIVKWFGGFKSFSQIPWKEPSQKALIYDQRCKRYPYKHILNQFHKELPFHKIIKWKDEQGKLHLASKTCFKSRECEEIMNSLHIFEGYKPETGRTRVWAPKIGNQNPKELGSLKTWGCVEVLTKKHYAYELDVTVSSCRSWQLIPINFELTQLFIRDVKTKKNYLEYGWTDIKAYKYVEEVEKNKCIDKVQFLEKFDYYTDAEEMDECPELERKMYEIVELEKKSESIEIEEENEKSVVAVDAKAIVNHYFPDELLLQIFSYLSVPNLGKLSLVCRRWYRVSSDSELWGRQSFSLDSVDIKVGSKEVLKLNYRCDSFPYQIVKWFGGVESFRQINWEKPSIQFLRRHSGSYENAVESFHQALPQNKIIKWKDDKGRLHIAQKAVITFKNVKDVYSLTNSFHIFEKYQPEISKTIQHLWKDRNQDQPIADFLHRWGCVEVLQKTRTTATHKETKELSYRSWRLINTNLKLTELCVRHTKYKLEYFEYSNAHATAYRFLKINKKYHSQAIAVKFFDEFDYYIKKK